VDPPLPTLAGSVNLRARIVGAAPRLPASWLPVALALSTVACLAGCGDEEKPCDPGTRRACEAASGEHGSRLCTASHEWSDTCEPTQSHCDPDECARYGLCRLTDTVLVANSNGTGTPALAVGEKELGCAWRGDASTGTSLWFGRFTPEGYYLSEPTLLGHSSFVYAYPEVVWGDGRYLSTWVTLATFQTISAGYVVLDGSGKVIGSDQSQAWTRMHPSPAEDGFFMVSPVVAQHVDRDGNLDTGMVQLVPTASLRDRPEIHDYVWTGEQHVLLLHDGREGFHLRRASAEGDPSGEPLSLSVGGCSTTQGAVLVYNGTELGIAASGGCGDAQDAVYFFRVSVDGEVVGEPLVVSDADGSKWDTPSLVWTGEDWVVAWVEKVDDVQQVFLRRLKADASSSWKKSQVSETARDAIFPALAAKDGAVTIAWDEFDDYDHDPGRMLFAQVRLCE
jgi:hypothetical protein